MHDYCLFLFSYECSDYCCSSIKLDTIGGGSFYQGERLGVYGKISNSQDGRNVYKQVNGDNYLFFLQSQKVRNVWFLES